MNRLSHAQREGSSHLETLIVVVAIAVVAAVSIPQRSRGSAGPDDSSVAGSLATLRSAIDLYSAEHGGAFPTAAAINLQLTQYTDVAGAVSTTRTIPFVYGPYLPQIPSLSMGVRRGNNKIAASDAEDVGWLYTEATGQIIPNTATQADYTQQLLMGN